MIIAIEGVDCAGKSWLFNSVAEELPGVVQVPRLLATPSTMHCMREITRSLVHLWSCVYDPERVYLCDRFFAVSSPVYDRLYRRPELDFSSWYKCTYVILLDPSVAKLKERYKARGDELTTFDNIVKAKQLYSEHVKNFVHKRFTGKVKVEEAVKCVISWSLERAYLAQPLRVPQLKRARPA